MNKKDKLLRKEGVPGNRFRKFMDKIFSSDSEKKPKSKDVKETAKDRWKSLGKRLKLKR
jgi:hypothetical protein